MKPINYKALWAKIKEYRKKENITQEQLAEMADISLSHMSNVETASVSVSLPALKLIADALGVTIDELLVDSYSKKQKKYFYSKKMDLIMEQCETVEQEIIVNTVSTLADNLLKSRKKKGVWGLLFVVIVWNKKTEVTNFGMPMARFELART